MKKLYIGMFALALAAGANAQSTLVDKYKGNPHNDNAAIQHSNSSIYEKALVIWESTFDTPSEWTMTNTSQPTSYDWVISTNQNDIPDAATSLKPFASTTASDGFALINSDGQPGNSDGDGAIVAEITNTVPVNLGSYPDVVLRYQHSYRWWHEDRGVRVSADGGATWTDFPVTSDQGGVIANGYPNNQNSENPTIETINISAIAGNSTNVLVQFYYNDNDFWGWYWVVDDVQILEQPDNDMNLLTAWVSGDNNDGIEYGRTPTAHLDASWTVGGQVFNFGLLDQTNVVLDADFTSFTSQSTQATLLADDTTILESTETPTLAPGVYTGNYMVQSAGEMQGGADFSDNVYTRVFEVTNDWYAIDGIGNNPAQHEALSTISTASFNNAADGLIVAAEYRLKQQETISGIRLMLSSSTVPGGYVFAQIIDTGDFRNDIINPIAITQAVDITAAHVSAGYVDVLFDNLQTLNAGAYYAAVDLNSNANSSDIVVIDDQTVAQPAWASAIYIPSDQSYTNGTAIGVRLLTGDQWGVGIEENTLVSSMNVYPNPANEEATVSFELANASDVAITVTDLSGKAVYSTSMSNVAAGLTEVAINTSSLSNGVYVVNVSSDNAVSTQQLVIRK